MRIFVGENFPRIVPKLQDLGGFHPQNIPCIHMYDKNAKQSGCMGFVLNEQTCTALNVSIVSPTPTTCRYCRSVLILIMQGRAENGWSSTTSKGHMMRRCPGVSTSISSLASRRGARGLESKHTSVCNKMVVSSLNINITYPTTHLR